MEILEIRKVREFQNFQKVRPYVLEKPSPLGRAILEILEMRKVRVKIFGNFGFCSLRLK